MLDLPPLALGMYHARFAFAGVAFNVEAAPDVRWELEPKCAELTDDVAGQRTFAQLICEVQLDPALPEVRTRAITIEHARGITYVANQELCAELIQVSPSLYRARVRMAPEGASALVLGLATAIHERRGGLSLHAAAIELDGRAVLFIGPSGAGKSTAVLLARGAPVFAYDRVAVSPQHGAFTAFCLPAGSRVEAPRSVRRDLPLGAVYRIRQAHDRPRIERLTTARALFALRESTEVTDPSQLAEQRRLEVAGALLACVRVAELHTVLGSAHPPLLECKGAVHAFT